MKKLLLYIVLVIILLTSVTAYEYDITKITCYGDYRVKVTEHKNVVYNVNNCENTNITDVWRCSCSVDETNIKLNIIDEIQNKYDFVVEYYTDVNQTEMLKQTWRKIGVNIDSRKPMTQEEINSMVTNIFIVIGIVVLVVGLIIGSIWFFIHKITYEDDEPKQKQMFEKK